MDWSSVVVAAVTAAGTVGVGRAARRTPRQERRDDFTKVTERLDKDIERLEGRITRQDTQISGQTSAIGYLSGWVRTLVLFTRASGLEPPGQPRVPEEAKPYLHDIGV
ncbi:hypothetical protein [Streptomyces sp.]|uniref:hypothetical protein n=1 Tax=Streptomyces sp. TaxID=1931 RepID=UPI002F420B0E